MDETCDVIESPANRTLIENAFGKNPQSITEGLSSQAEKTF